MALRKWNAIKMILTTLLGMLMLLLCCLQTNSSTEGSWVSVSPSLILGWEKGNATLKKIYKSYRC